MKRRKFIASTLAASAVPLSYVSSQTSKDDKIPEKELYELRTYEIKFRGNLNLLKSYLNNALRPALERAGVNHILFFEELGNADPKKIWALLSYPSADIYLKAQNLQADKAFLSASKEYDTAPANQPIFNRYTSSLLLAFDGLPKMLSPIDGASIFELRIYEGYNEDAVKRKINMFNDEEIDLFHRVNLHPVFFGDMIAGPHRPALVYMLNFKNMEQRDANWKKFIEHPEWNKMKGEPKYANTVSNIRKTFLSPMKF